MKNAHYIVFDTETGGTDESLNPMLEIAMVVLDGKTLDEIDRFECLIQPYDDLVVEKEALKVNGLRIADIMQNGFTKSESFKKIHAFIKKQNPKGNKFNRPIMVGHNVQFDMGFMEMFYYLNKGNDFYSIVSRTALCTMGLAKMYGKTERLDLGSLCEEFGVTLNNAHKAMPDTLATAELFRRMTMKLRTNSSASGKVQQDKKSRDKFQF